MATNDSATVEGTALEIESADETTARDRVDETADWEAIARNSAATLLRQALADVEKSTGRVEHRLRGHGRERLTADDVREARRALYELEQTLEENVVPAVDGVESYESSAQHIPFGELAGRLGVELSELEESESE
ncbi:hypothetical protein [Natrinema hispanicum]|uniref:Uncharacterized protein n=1 Tax=Natrinema hispanicum TaxID=392421 RepID=A0A1G6XPH7_9EURY|nr:hypothetical protein [Natrinema hispanicum]SDD79871.1 hypothetical protein SAMN05192552_105010 [Natrinema hispanicum]